MHHSWREYTARLQYLHAWYAICALYQYFPVLVWQMLKTRCRAVFVGQASLFWGEWMCSGNKVTDGGQQSRSCYRRNWEDEAITFEKYIHRFSDVQYQSFEEEINEISNKKNWFCGCSEDDLMWFLIERKKNVGFIDFPRKVSAQAEPLHHVEITSALVIIISLIWEWSPVMKVTLQRKCSDRRMGGGCHWY